MFCVEKATGSALQQICNKSPQYKPVMANLIQDHNILMLTLETFHDSFGYKFASVSLGFEDMQDWYKIQVQTNCLEIADGKSAPFLHSSTTFARHSCESYICVFRQICKMFLIFFWFVYFCCCFFDSVVLFIRFKYLFYYF